MATPGRRATRGCKNAAYDFIVVGAGSAGCVVAARLAEDGKNSVLLLEAGPRDGALILEMPAALGLPLANDKYNWSFHSEPEPFLGGRRIYEARGRVLGGSSSLNGMNWVRGNAWDFDHWASRSLPSWSYRSVLPYFKKAETFAGGENVYRGGSGPMHIETCKAKNLLFESFLRAGVEAGHALNSDHNAANQEGMHVTQRNVHRGHRWSTSRAYLRERGPRDNLTVETGARVTQVELSGRRAVRVRYWSRGSEFAVEAGREVILSAGALQSPQILMLSGIGDPTLLTKHGIATTADVPGVGRELKDHVAAPVQYRITRPVSAARQLGRLGQLRIGAEWLLFKTGVGATNFFEVGGFIRTRDGLPAPNIQYEFVPMLGELQHGGVKLEEGFQYFFSLQRPQSSGAVSLTSADPLADPSFHAHYLADRNDVAQMIEAVRLTRTIIKQSAWDALRGEEVTPGAEVATDAEIEGWLREVAGTNYHVCRSCRMGVDDNSVVDERAVVHGLENLRVVDASILPEIPTGNLNAPVIMMAEKLADAILGRRNLPPAVL